MISKDYSRYGTLETDCGRYYFLKSDPATLFPSVSTIIHGSKKSSGFVSPYAAIGSLIHWKILKCYADRPLPRPTDPIYKMEPEEIERRIESCMMQWDKLQLRIKPIVVETAMFSRSPRVGGRCDLFCYLDGVRTLLDIKTGKEYKDNITQAAGYVNMLRWSPKQAALVYLDADLERNPEQQGHVKILKRPELEKGFEDFLDKYSGFDFPEFDFSKDPIIVDQ